MLIIDEMVFYSPEDTGSGAVDDNKADNADATKDDAKTEDTKTDDEVEDKALTAEQVAKMIQSEADKVRTEYTKKTLSQLNPHTLCLSVPVSFCSPFQECLAFQLAGCDNHRVSLYFI
jgi:hypothetical protein